MNADRSPSLPARGMLAGIVLGSGAATWLFLATGSALAFTLIGLAAAVGLSVGALLDRRAGERGD
ncbi:MAG: hypothetical protein GVY27_05235 [Deinococcus-Thermus bacterium]|nr:hypothetical protein [Deinococcota bacterium]